MCFEFEALYWAKLAEEQERKKDQAGFEARKDAADASTEVQHEEQPLPA